MRGSTPKPTRSLAARMSQLKDYQFNAKNNPNPKGNDRDGDGKRNEPMPFAKKGKKFKLTGDMVAKMRGEVSRSEISRATKIPIDHASLPHTMVDAHSASGAGYFHEPPKAREEKLMIGGDAVTLQGKMSGTDYAHMGRAHRTDAKPEAMQAKMTDYAGRTVSAPSWADPGFTPPTVAGPAPLQLSQKATWFQQDLYAQPGVKKSVPEVRLAHLVDDREDPSVSLRKSMHRKHNELWDFKPAKLRVTTDVACPVHSRDIKKSQNLWNPMTPCTCPKQGE